MRCVAGDTSCASEPSNDAASDMWKFDGAEVVAQNFSIERCMVTLLSKAAKVAMIDKTRYVWKAVAEGLDPISNPRAARAVSFSDVHDTRLLDRIISTGYWNHCRSEASSAAARKDELSKFQCLRNDHRCPFCYDSLVAVESALADGRVRKARTLLMSDALKLADYDALILVVFFNQHG